MAIAALTVDINAQLAGIEGDLGKVSRLAEQSAAKMSRAFDSVGESLRNVFSGVAIGSVGSGFGRLMLRNVFAGVAIGSVIGFGRLITEALDAQDALSDLSKSTAISIELLAGLKGAAITSGTDLEGVAAAVNKLSVNIGKNAEQFAAVGITAREPLEALKQLADVYAAIEDRRCAPRSPPRRSASRGPALPRCSQTAVSRSATSSTSSATYPESPRNRRRPPQS